MHDFLCEEFNLVIGKLKGTIWMTEKRQEVCVRMLANISSIFTFVTDIIYLGSSFFRLVLKH